MQESETVKFSFSLEVCGHCLLQQFLILVKIHIFQPRKLFNACDIAVPINYIEIVILLPLSHEVYLALFQSYHWSHFLC